MPRRILSAIGSFEASHGTKNVRGYLRRLRAGGLRAAGRPRLAAEGPAWGIVDGDSALGMVTSVFSIQTAIVKARACGIAYVGVRNSCHFGAAGYYSWLAAREGMIGLSMSNDIPSVAAPGSRGAIMGSNPIAYAIPGGRHPPLLLDMSTATVAGGKVYAARTRGERIPDTWLIGADGRPTTDQSGYPDVGALQPAAGHKGYGIALLIETLSGILCGAFRPGHFQGVATVLRRRTAWKKPYDGPPFRRSNFRAAEDSRSAPATGRRPLSASPARGDE